MSTHIPSSQTTEDDSFRTVINEYQGFLSHQAMAPSSIESYLGRSRHFLIWLNRNGLGLSEVDGEVAVRFQAHDCTCFGRSCARPKLRPARTPAGSSSSRVMRFERFLELSGRTPTPGELEDNLARVPAFLHELRRQGYTQSRVDRFRYGATAFIAWLHLSRMRLRDIDAGTLERFYHRRFACSIPGICWGRRSEHERGYRPDIPRFLDHLADTGQIEPWRRALGTHRECFAGFRAWLARTRDISARRINDHIKQIQAVLPALGEVPESYDAALIRRVMLAHLERGSRSRARVTFRCTVRTVPIAFSMALVQASERRSCGGRPSRITVRISSRPSRIEPETPGASCSRRRARLRKSRSALAASSCCQACRKTFLTPAWRLSSSRSVMLRPLCTWQRWRAAARPKVRRIAFESALAPSTM